MKFDSIPTTVAAVFAHIVDEVARLSATRLITWEPKQLLSLIDSTEATVDKHFIFSDIVELAYAQRRDDPHMAELCVQVGRRHIDEFADIRLPLQVECYGLLPPVRTFTYVATVLGEERRFEEAIGVCQVGLQHDLGNRTVNRLKSMANWFKIHARDCMGSTTL
ncbi:MAG: hypothetical protein BWY85_02456 [Firmicutes bacterium ADurb.Bin506]|jgi:hypothetical protein|nr:MAG: hypothetical protein BWY85_02456 [Firmicutes bacterium ADurb.Bin506]